MTLAFLYSAGTSLGAPSAVPAPRMANGTDMLLPVSLVGFLIAQLDDLAGEATTAIDDSAGNGVS